jgi:hypothetical protein
MEMPRGEARLPASRQRSDPNLPDDNSCDHGDARICTRRRRRPRWASISRQLSSVAYQTAIKRGIPTRNGTTKEDGNGRNWCRHRSLSNVTAGSHPRPRPGPDASSRTSYDSCASSSGRQLTHNRRVGGSRHGGAGDMDPGPGSTRGRRKSGT